MSTEQNSLTASLQASNSKQKQKAAAGRADYSAELNAVVGAKTLSNTTKARVLNHMQQLIDDTMAEV